MQITGLKLYKENSKGIRESHLSGASDTSAVKLISFKSTETFIAD